jgi:hypothetical protein
MCERTFCRNCGEEMIHRDNRHSYEASSALNQIIHREGPRNLTVGDCDTYSMILLPDFTVCVRLLEHKQPKQALKPQQAKALAVIDRMFRHAASDKLKVWIRNDQYILAPDSGVFLVRGHLKAGKDGHRKVDFADKPIVETLEGKSVLVPKNRKALWDWLCCGDCGLLRNEPW